jgi:hypothetical protein
MEAKTDLSDLPITKGKLLSKKYAREDFSLLKKSY